MADHSKRKKIMANYDENLVNAVAEKSWWEKTSIQKLAEKFDPTEAQLDQLRATPEYHCKVVSLMVGQRLSEGFEKWVKGYPNMNKNFGRRMGLDPEVVLVLVEEARQWHADIAAGKAKPPKYILDPDKFDTSSQVEVIGKGSESVYLYYFPTYQRYAESLGAPHWRCNIGKAEDDPAYRVSQQIGDRLPEKPQIALILRTDNCRTLEKKIHNVLKRKGKHIQDAIGKEWFLTSPSKVEAIYQRIYQRIDV